MKGSNFSAAFFLILAAITVHSPAQASKTPEFQRAAPQDVLNARAALKTRLDRAALSMGKAPREGRIAQWYNSRFSKRGFSNW